MSWIGPMFDEPTKLLGNIYVSWDKPTAVRRTARIPENWCNYLNFPRISLISHRVYWYIDLQLANCDKCNMS